MFSKFAFLFALALFPFECLRAVDDAKEISIEAFTAKGGRLQIKPALDVSGRNVELACIGLLATAKDAQAARFRKVPGLADPKGVSFESVQQPGKHLKAHVGRLILVACAKESDKNDATFRVVAGLASTENGWLSLELLARPGQFLCSRDGGVTTEQKKADAPSKEAATFRLAEPAAPKKIPISGTESAGVDVLDQVVLNYLGKIGCSAATLTVLRGKELLYSRGYGWSDRFGETPILPDAPMTIASCDKPVTAAAIRQLARGKKLDLNAKVFDLLKIKPAGPVVDERVRAITVAHVIDHKAGWPGDPVNRAYKAALKKGHQAPIPTETLLEFVMAEKLKDPPGAKVEFCNEDYAVLRLIIARLSGQNAADYFRQQLCRPYGVTELKGVQQAGAPLVQGEPAPVWNAHNLPIPAAEGLCLSTPAMCGFMRFFSWNGEPRGKAATSASLFGIWVNATSVMTWRSDGINVACVFNGASNDVKYQDIEKDLAQAIDKLKKEKRIR